MQLDPKSYLSLHLQLKNEIERKIIARDYVDQIPSERELMETYDTSRSTVRKAIGILVREGVLEKRHGKGTYISIKPIHNWLGHLSSTTETIQNLGMKPGAELISYKRMKPSAHIQHITGLEEVFFIKRIRYADRIPVGVECHYYPLKIGEALMAYDLDKVTLYDLVENDLGIQFIEAEQKISSGPIPTGFGKYLNIEENTNVLKADRIIKGQAGEVIEFEQAFYRSDIYSFEINLSRKNG
ncbi:MAG TPA: GntR family transcriptional regulator [Virgibacillus sp.]|nr:GntR family transcriptional regulator [Virgibacillus sp.]